MRAIYRYDGTIKGLTDSTKFGAVITEEQYANKTLYRVNPNTKEVYLVPTCEARFIRIVDSVITEFSAEEKAAILAAEAAREAARIAQQIEYREQEAIRMAQEEVLAAERKIQEEALAAERKILEEAQEIENKERIRVETLKREMADIDTKSIRGIREFILTLQDAPERLKIYEADAEKKRAEI